MFEDNFDFNEFLSDPFPNSSPPPPPPKTANNNESNGRNKRNHDTSSRSLSLNRNLVVKRKFPGPAGILLPPECPTNNPDDFERNLAKSTNNNQDNIVIIPCSQDSFRDDYTGGAWRAMLDDYRTMIIASDNNNIAAIKRAASTARLINRKAPFLAAVIDTIECHHAGKTPIVNVRLRDSSGEIHGTIMHTVYDRHADDLRAGAVLVLKQFSVLTTATTCNHYLTITANNLLAIYNNSDEGVNRVVLSLATLRNNNGGCKMVEAEVPIAPSLSTNSNTNLLFDDDDFDDDTVDSFFMASDAAEAATTSITVDDKMTMERRSYKQQLSVAPSASAEESQIWQDALEGIDPDLFLSNDI